MKLYEITTNPIDIDIKAADLIIQGELAFKQNIDFELQEKLRKEIFHFMLQHSDTISPGLLNKLQSISNNLGSNKNNEAI